MPTYYYTPTVAAVQHYRVPVNLITYDVVLNNIMRTGKSINI